MLARSGLMPAPCGVPSTVSAYPPSSITPARSHSRISLRMRGSAIRCAIIRISHAWSTRPKKLRMSASTTQPTRSVMIAACTARSASCALRPGRNPNEVFKRGVVEIGLIDGVQHFSHRALDDLVLDCENAECSLPSVSRRDVGPPHRPRPVLVRLEAGVERLEIGLQVALVVRHRHPIHAGRCLPPQPSERPFERLAREVVEQRREPGLARPDGRRRSPERDWRAGGSSAVSGPAASRSGSPVVGAFPPSGSCPSPSSTVLRPNPPPCRPWSQSSGLPRCCPPPVTKPERSAGLPRFRWCLCVHDQVFDPGGSASVSPLRRKRCCLRHLKQPRQPR